MRFPKNIKFLIPSLIFILTGTIKSLNVFSAPHTAHFSGGEMDKLFFYLIDVSFWLSAAFLINGLSHIFLWGGFLKKPTAGKVYNYLIDFFSVLTITIALALIISSTFNQTLSVGWILFLVIFLLAVSSQRSNIMNLLNFNLFTIERVFNIGDWIELLLPGGRSLEGEVMDFNRKSLKLKTENNNILTVPANVLNESVIKNFWGSGKETRFEVSFTIDLNVSVERVKRILHAGAKQAVMEKGILKAPEPEILIKSVSERGIEYSVYFWIVPWLDIKPGAAKDMIISIIIKHLKSSGISFAYPKMDVYHKAMPERLVDLSSSAGRITFVSQVELFDSLDDTDIKFIADNLKYFEIKQGAEIIRQSKAGNSMFVLAEGLLNVFVKGSEDNMVKVGQISPGEYFGEMSLLTGEPRSATIIAATNAAIFEITKDHLEPILKNRAELIDSISETVIKRQEINLHKVDELKNRKSKIALLVGKIRRFFNLG